MPCSVPLLFSVVTYAPGANAKAPIELAAENLKAIFIRVYKKHGRVTSSSQRTKQS